MNHVAPVPQLSLSQDLSGVPPVGLLRDGLTVDGVTLTWQVPSLAVGEQTEVTYAVLINDDAYDRQLRNVATPGEDGGCTETCSTEHTTSPAPTAPTPPAPTPPAPTPPPPGPAQPMPPTDASGVLPLAPLGFALVLGGGLLVRRRQRGGH